MKKVAVVDDATAYGEGLANEVEKTLKAAGVKIVAREKTNDKATDFKAILTKIKGTTPDAVFYGGMDATGGPMLKQARELGIKAVFRFGDGACTDKMAKLAGAAAEGLVCSQAGLPVEAASPSFLDGLQGEVQRRSDHLRAVHLRRGQPADRRDAEGRLGRPGEVPAGAAEDCNSNGATGTIEFDDKGDRKDAEITIFTLKDGKVDSDRRRQGRQELAFADVHGGQRAGPGRCGSGCGARLPAPADAPKK